MTDQKSIDDETLWGVPDKEAQQGIEALLPAEIEDIQKEAEITEQMQGEKEW